MRIVLVAALGLATLAAIPTAHAAGPVTNPCTTGIAGSWCTASAADCSATVGVQTAPEHYEYARAYCGPELWAPCQVAYADTRGNVDSCLLP